jgi:type IV pilus assembly protein PilN
VVIFVIIAIIFGIWSFFSSQTKSDELDQKMTEYQSLEVQIDAKKIQFSELETKTQSLSSKLEASSGIVSNQKFMHSVLLGINSAVPQGVSLNSIDYQGGNIVTIVGLSISDHNILEFIEKLPKSKVIDKSSLLTMSIKTIDKQIYKSFSIKCTLVQQQSAIKQEKSNGN